MNRCRCGAPWQRHYRAGVLVSITCTRGHEPIESVSRRIVSETAAFVSRDLEKRLG